MKLRDYVCVWLVVLISATVLAQVGFMPVADQSIQPPTASALHPAIRPTRPKMSQPRSSLPRNAGTPATSGLAFANVVLYLSGGQQPRSVAVADVNGDGKPDLLVANIPCTECSTSDGTVGVLLGNGDGTFQRAVTYDSGGPYPSSVAVADVNGDGKPDLLVANQCASTSNCNNGGVGVLLGNGDGTFQTAVTYSSGGQTASSIVVADVNGDGKPDLLVANWCADSACANGTVGVLLGNGDGTFQTAVTYGSGGYAADSLAVADVNGDGKLDLVVANQCLNYFYSMCSADAPIGLLLGNGDGTFQTVVTYTSGGVEAASVAVADVNGDGKPDLLVANFCADAACTTNSTVGVLLGNGDGSFKTAVSYGSGGNLAQSVAVADVNGDGNPDLVVANSCATNCSSVNTLGVLLGKGDGTFLPVATFGPGGDYTLSVAVADVNEDGKPDLVVANCAAYGSFCGRFGSGAVGVLINTSVHGPLGVFLPASLNFGSQTPGTGSAAQIVALTNAGNVNLTITSIQIGGTNKSDFAQSNNCPASLPPLANCTISAIFTPKDGGARSATVTVTDNASGSPQELALTGTAQDFSLTGSSQTSQTVNPGEVANYSIGVSPSDGLAQKVAFTCSGAPLQSTCAVTPSSVMLDGTHSATVNVAVATQGPSASLVQPFGLSGNRLALWLAMLGLAGFACLGRGGRTSGKSHGRVLSLLALFCVLSLVITWTGCGGGNGSTKNTAPGTYPITVSGTFTSGSVSVAHKTILTLVVE